MTKFRMIVEHGGIVVWNGSLQSICAVVNTMLYAFFGLAFCLISY